MMTKSVLTVHIADDSWHIRQRLLQRLNELPGVKVVGQSGDFCKTLVRLAQLQPDVLILDIHLPGGSGFEILTALKRARAEVTIIVFTAAGYTAYADKALSAGASYYFDKIEDFEQIKIVLEQLRDQKHAMFLENQAKLR